MECDFETDTATTSYADGEQIDLKSTGQYCVGFKMGKRVRDIRGVPAPGEDGSGTQDFGDRDQYFSVQVTYVGDTESSIQASIKADLFNLAQLSNADFTDFSYIACKLEDNRFEQTRPASRDNVTTNQCTGWLTFRCFRP